MASKVQISADRQATENNRTRYAARLDKIALWFVVFSLSVAVTLFMKSNLAHDLWPNLP